MACIAIWLTGSDASPLIWTLLVSGDVALRSDGEPESAGTCGLDPHPASKTATVADAEHRLVRMGKL